MTTLDLSSALSTSLSAPRHRGTEGAKGAPERWALRPAGVAVAASLRADETPLCGHLYGRMTCTRLPHPDHPHGHAYASSDGSSVPDRHHEAMED